VSNPLPHTSAARVIIELVRSGQSVQFRARGSSMWPTIPSRSRVEVSPCPVSELQVGQIAAFERAGQIVVDRVQRISPEGVFFAGDSRDAGDGCIAPAHVLGRARVVERRELHFRLPGRWHLRWLWRTLVRRCGRG